MAEELHGLIEDMLDERLQDRDVKEEDVEEVLLELGHPRSLARKYRSARKYLICPELYDLYMLVLKIGLISAVSVFTTIFVIQVILNPMNVLDYFVNYIVSFFTSSIPMVIGWTTLGFALAEYFSAGKLDLDKGWKPSNLAPVPDPNRQIKRSEPIAGIIFYVLIIVFLAFSNDYFGIWLFQDGEFSGIVKECLKFMYEKWTFSLVGFTAIVNLISRLFV